MQLLDFLIILAICYLIYYLFFQNKIDGGKSDEFIIEDIDTDQNGNITNNNLCLDSKLINNKRYVIPTVCNLKQDQMMDYNLETNTIKNIEKCFYIDEENQLQLQKCNNTNAQKFIYDKKQKFIKSKFLNNKCLEYKGENQPIVLNTCNSNIKNQTFEFNGDKDIDSVVSLSILEKCVEIKDNDYSNGAIIQLNDCNYNDNQKFRYKSKEKKFESAKDKTKCLDLNYLTQKIDLWNCNNLPTQKFIYNQLEQVIKLENKCLSAKDGKNTVGNQLALIDCKIPSNGETTQVTISNGEEIQTTVINKENIVSNEDQKFILMPIANTSEMQLPQNTSNQNGNITINKQCMMIPNTYGLSNIKPTLKDCNLTKKQMFEYDIKTKRINTSLDKNKCLDINNGNINNIITIQNCNDSNSQKFDYDTANKLIKCNFNNSRCIEYKNNNFIVSECNLNNKNQKIEFNGSKDILGGVNFNIKDKCVAIPDGSNKNGTKVELQECDGGYNKELFYSSKNNSIKFETKCLGYNASNNRLEINKCIANSPNQKLIYNPTTQELMHNNKCINLTGKEFDLQTCNQTENQQFNISGIEIDEGDNPQAGFIVNKRKCLDLNSGDTNNGKHINIWQCDNSERQQFEYSPEDRSFKYSKNKKKCLDIGGGMLKIWDCNNSIPQKFYYNSIDKKIKLYDNPNLCIDLKNDNSANGNTYQVIGCYNGNHPAQQFVFNDNNYVKDYSGPIIIREKCVDVKKAKTDNKTKVQINDCNNEKEQEFIYSTSDNLIRSKLNNNKCLDFNGQVIYLYDCNGQSNQQFTYDEIKQQFKQNNKCLDLNRDDSTNGTEFGLITCKENHGAQQFIISPSI